MSFWKRLFGPSKGSTVKFVRRYTESCNTPSGPAKFNYEIYRAATAQDAREFLESRTVSEALFYIVVETPEGNWGKDINGVYKED